MAQLALSRHYGAMNRKKIHQGKAIAIGIINWEPKGTRKMEEKKNPGTSEKKHVEEKKSPSPGQENGKKGGLHPRSLRRNLRDANKTQI